jgi:tyrosyl-tRNA synthetase
MNNPEEIIFRGATHVVVKEDLEKRLAGGEKLRIKLGIDPTGNRLTIGHAVNLWRLKAFQQLGHQIVLIIGTFTGQVGDTSDKESERPMLNALEVLENSKHYSDFASRVLDMKSVEVRANGDWFNEMDLSKFMALQQLFSVAQMIERDNFDQRMKKGDRVGLHELSYAILQGYDSVVVEADVEIGGNDQLFNVLAGRTVQKAHDQRPQDVIVYDLLLGSDGKKMSKTSGNCIWIDDEANDMYGKVMRISDDMILHYFEMATLVSNDKLEEVKSALDGEGNPRDIKAELARTITALYHGEDAAIGAGEAFNSQFSDGNLPDDIPEMNLREGEWQVADLLLEAGLVESKSEARRLLEQGAVKLNQEKVESEKVNVKSGDVIQAGKRRFVKVK